jgi:2-amino-4-hydroxy-6-hydroxymethyldihydropteridine diphosphokinase
VALTRTQPPARDHEACIGLGSNLGDSRAFLHAAWHALGQYPGIQTVLLSSPYRSQPVDMASPHWFVNAVGCIRTRLSPDQLLQTLHAIETRFGRCRDPLINGYQDRTLDLDLLLYDDWVVHTEHLIIPHPLMERRRFVLEPLTEIGANRVHPLCGKDVATLLDECMKNYSNQIIEKLSWSC